MSTTQTTFRWKKKRTSSLGIEHACICCCNLFGPEANEGWIGEQCFNDDSYRAKIMGLSLLHAQHAFVAAIFLGLRPTKGWIGEHLSFLVEGLTCFYAMSFSSMQF